MRFPVRSLLLILITSLPPSAHAALGGKAESLGNTDTAIIARKQLRSTPSNGYTIQESVSAGGIAVREYISPQSIVFAVAWSGPSMPDLQELLGNYFPQFKDALKERRRRGIRGPVAVKQDDLVVESRGHMRDFRGRAYAPGLIPPQVSIEEIQ